MSVLPLIGLIGAFPTASTAGTLGATPASLALALATGAVLALALIPIATARRRRRSCRAEQRRKTGYWPGAPLQSGIILPEVNGPQRLLEANVVKRTGYWILGAAIVVGAILVIVNFAVVRHWLAVHTGTVNESGPYYGFWSGFGSDIGEATLIGAVSVGVYTGARKVNCHTKGCWRIGHHPLEGTPYHLCKHHHPDVPVEGASIEHILGQHEKFKDAQAAARGDQPVS